jgi:hypothetical protein
VRWSGENRYRPEVAIDRHGTITTIDGPMSSVVQRDLATGEELREIPIDAVMVALSSDRVAAVLGSKQTGRVLVYDRAGRLAVKLDTPRCPPGVAAGHR